MYSCKFNNYAFRKYLIIIFRLWPTKKKKKKLPIPKIIFLVQMITNTYTFFSIIHKKLQKNNFLKQFLNRKDYFNFSEENIKARLIFYENLPVETNLSHSYLRTNTWHAYSTYLKKKKENLRQFPTRSYFKRYKNTLLTKYQ